MRILIVEDDQHLAELLRRGLEGQGHAVESANDGLQGLKKAQSLPLDAIVLDVMLPGLGGLYIARRLRSDNNRVPILMLTARDAVQDIVKGLDVGADDYLTKPFSFDVLAARLRAIARRGASEIDHVLQVADLTLNADTHEVYRARRQLALTRTEFVLLECLMRRAGRVVSRGDLYQAAWGYDRDIDENTLGVYIFQLRSKIESGGASRLIRTVRGFGYVIREGNE